MKVCDDSAALQAVLKNSRKAGERIAFVPTMGNLHAGHISLIELAKARSDRVVVSIFVNPTQFAPHEDYDTYPRTFNTDCDKLRAHDVDIVFAPSVPDIYGERVEQSVEVGALGKILCGVSRPHFFDGVATVVSKLFEIVQPDVAVFGKKDYQQFRVIEKIVGDANLPVELIAGDILREADGLAMSSRNGYLTAGEREDSTALFTVLNQVRDRLLAGSRQFAVLEAAGEFALSERGFSPDYFAIRRQSDLAPAADGDNDLVVLAAATLGTTRLIDNLEVTL